MAKCRLCKRELVWFEGVGWYCPLTQHFNIPLKNILPHWLYLKQEILGIGVNKKTDIFKVYDI